MLELTPPLTPGSGRLAVHVMEPGGSLWLWRRQPNRFAILLVPARLRNVLADMVARQPADKPLHLYRRTSIDTDQELTLEPDDLPRVRDALATLERFEADPELPEWHARGYLTAAEADAINAAHPEWWAGLDEGADR